MIGKRRFLAGFFILTVFSLFIVSNTFAKENVNMAELSISSPSFRHNGLIPAKYTCDGDNMSPPLVIENVPQGVESLVLIVDDPDVPAGTWVHWVLWNIGPLAQEIRENSVADGAVQGLNDFGKSWDGGP